MSAPWYAESHVVQVSAAEHTSQLASLQVAAATTTHWFATVARRSRANCGNIFVGRSFRVDPCGVYGVYVWVWVLMNV